MKILAIGAHPDDIEFGCGGTLISLREKCDAELSMLVMTKGERFRYGETSREKEQVEASKVIGADFRMLDMKDTCLDMRECIDAIEDALGTIQPTHVFTPYGEDTHQDHRTLALATESAMRNNYNLLYYECISSKGLFPMIMSSIEDTIEKKCHALEKHESQLHLKLSDHARIVAQYHAYRSGFQYVEAFTARTLFLMDTMHFVKQEVQLG